MKLKTILFFLLFAVGRSFAGTVSNVDDLTTWTCVHDADTAGTSTGSTSLVSSPAKDGQARRFNISWTGFGGERCSAYLGSGNLDPNSTNFVVDLWLQISAVSHAHAIEIDLNQVLSNSQTVIYGHQCNFASGFWQYTTNVASAAHWNDSNVPCLTSDVTPNVWHHVTFTFHRNSTGTVTTYDSIAFDGPVHAFSGASGPSNFSLGWTPPGRQVVNFQIDGDNTANSTIAYVDSLSVTGSTAAAGSISDDFSTGSLNARWCVDTGPAPANVSGQNVGTFSAGNVDLTQGMLALKLTQSGAAPVTSIGAEVRSCQPLGFGSYEWTYRTASTATTPTGAGSATSGQDSGGFSFINNSETEIDFETEGQFPNRIEMTNWQTTANKQYTQYTLVNPDQAFHKYRFDWSSSKIDFYIDGILVSTHTLNIPQTPAYAMMSIFGTNSTSFGGLATSGIARYLYVSKFTFAPSAAGPAPPVGLAATIN